MSNHHKTPFHEIDEARLIAGFFVSEACQEIGISERSWYRWKSTGYGPKWALKCLEILSGNLDYFGWKHMYIKRGVLYSQELNPKYYNWEAADFLFTAFCRCPGHEQIRAARRGRIQSTEAEATTAGGSDVAPTRRLRGARAPAFHLPGYIGAAGAGDQ